MYRKDMARHKVNPELIRYRKELGNRIRYIRNLEEDMAKDIAEYLNISSVTFYDKETGDSAVTIPQFFNLGKLFGISLDSFFKEELVYLDYKDHVLDKDFISSTLKETRKFKELSLSTINSLCKFNTFSKTTLWNWENKVEGIGNTVDIILLKELADIYELTLDNLFGLNSIKPTNDTEVIIESNILEPEASLKEIEPNDYSSFITRGISLGMLRDPYIWKEYQYGDKNYILIGTWHNADVNFRLLEVNMKEKELVRRASSHVIKEELLFTFTDNIVMKMIKEINY